LYLYSYIRNFDDLKNKNPDLPEFFIKFVFIIVGTVFVIAQYYKNKCKSLNL